MYVAFRTPAEIALQKKRRRNQSRYLGRFYRLGDFIDFANVAQ
jgi:hypothetical protein